MLAHARKMVWIVSICTSSLPNSPGNNLSTRGTSLLSASSARFCDRGISGFFERECPRSPRLDVEREHFLTRRVERHNTVSVAKASRDNIIRKWRTWSRQRREAQGAHSHSSRVRHTKVKRQLRSMNIHSLAARKRPDLVRIPQGALWWQPTTSKQARKEVRQQGCKGAQQRCVPM